jgi:hypothetical protein
VFVAYYNIIYIIIFLERIRKSTKSEDNYSVTLWKMDPGSSCAPDGRCVVYCQIEVLGVLGYWGYWGAGVLV